MSASRTARWTSSGSRAGSRATARHFVQPLKSASLSTAMTVPENG